MTKVAITGAGGFVGSHILETILSETDWEVICLVSFRHGGITENLMLSDRVSVYVHDLTTPVSSVLLAKMGEIDYVVNAASLCSVDASIKDPIPFVQNNVSLMLNVLEMARQVSPKMFIQISTDEVYGNSANYEAANEQAGHKPSSPYAASKAAQEDFCWAYRRTYGLPIVVVNNSNMFGSRQSLAAFIPKVIRAVHKHETIRVHASNGHPGFRYYMHVSNLSAWVLDALNSEDIQEFKHHLFGEKAVDNLELVYEVGNLMGIEPAIEVVEAELDRPGYDRSYYMTSWTEWSPTTKFETGLSQTVDWANENKDWWLT